MVDGQVIGARVDTPGLSDGWRTGVSDSLRSDRRERGVDDRADDAMSACVGGLRRLHWFDFICPFPLPVTRRDVILIADPFSQ